MIPADAAARRHVRALARSSGSSFYYAFLLLPREQRDAILAVYAFCHGIDAAVDENADPERARRELDDWRRRIDEALAGRPAGPLEARLAAVTGDFDIPTTLLDDVMAGVAMDLAPRRFATWDELAGYADLVAGAVGRICVRIFGRRDERADRYAVELGRALQLTNILRDIGPDARLGRFYLPLEELERFGLREEDVLGTAPGRRRLLEHEAARAREHYERAAQLGRPCRREFFAAEIMGTIYRDLLGRIERAGFPAGPEPLRVPRPRKLVLALGTWASCRFSR
jgi:phytoene synthase